MAGDWWRLDKYEYIGREPVFRITNMNCIDKSIGGFSSYEEMLVYAAANGISFTNEKLHVFGLAGYAVEEVE